MGAGYEPKFPQEDDLSDHHFQSATRRETIELRIMANVAVVDGPLPSPCFVWQGSHSGTGRGGGYPRMSLDGATVAVHRVVWTNMHGFIPPKKQIDHRCKNRMCVNHLHLEMVTHRLNQRRRVTPTDILYEGFSE
jgi:hypothetical protein